MLSCGCDGYIDDFDWIYYASDELEPLTTVRRRRCCGCGDLIDIGSSCQKLSRARSARHDIEESIYGEEVPLASWYNCETCADLFMSVSDTGYCVSLNTNWRPEVIEELRAINLFNQKQGSGL